MKKSLTVFLSACVLWVMTFQTSCIGSFNLTKAYWDWCNGLGNKWVNELVYIVTAWLVFPIALFIDAVILNLIEFWSGSNPMAMNEGDMEQQVVVGKDGNTYEITATKNRFDIIQLSGDDAGTAQAVVYNPEEKSWSHEKGCEVNKVSQYSSDGSLVSIYSKDGRIATLPSNISDKNLAAKMVSEQLESQLCVN